MRVAGIAENCISVLYCELRVLQRRIVDFLLLVCAMTCMVSRCNR